MPKHFKIGKTDIWVQLIFALIFGIGYEDGDIHIALGCIAIIIRS